MSCDCREDENVLEYYKGDTFYRQVTIQSSGEDIDPSYITKVEFVLLTADATPEMTSELNYDTNIEKWIVNEDTSEWAIGSHLMRYKITYTDGQIRTPYERTLQIKK